jgi:hypothetical protein
MGYLGRMQRTAWNRVFFRVGTRVNSGVLHKSDVEHAQNSDDIAETCVEVASDGRVTGIEGMAIEKCAGGYSVTCPETATL